MRLRSEGASAPAAVAPLTHRGPHAAHMLGNTKAGRGDDRQLEFLHLDLDELIMEAKAEGREEAAPGSRLLRARSEVLAHLFDAGVAHLGGEAGDGGELHLELGFQLVSADYLGREVDGAVVAAAHGHDGGGLWVFEVDALALLEVLSVGHAEALHGQRGRGLVKNEVGDGVAAFIVRSNHHLRDPLALERRLLLAVVRSLLRVPALGKDLKQRRGPHHLGAQVGLEQKRRPKRGASQ